MSRLESFIRRMQAQRDCINLAAGWVEDVPGVVWEFGLGNARSYDHLRETFKDRDVYVFDLEPYAPLEFRPPENRLVVGDVRETVPREVSKNQGAVALLHYDVGTGTRSEDLRLAEELSAVISPAIAPGGIVMGVYELSLENAERMPLPDGIAEGRYFIYRLHGA